MSPLGLRQIGIIRSPSDARALVIRVWNRYYDAPCAHCCRNVTEIGASAPAVRGYVWAANQPSLKAPTDASGPQCLGGMPVEGS